MSRIAATFTAGTPGEGRSAGQETRADESSDDDDFGVHG